MVGGGARRSPDDVEHYQSLLRRLTRVEIAEVREDEELERRIPDWADVVLLDAGGRELSSEGFAAFLEQRRQAGLDVVFVLGGAG